MSNIIFNKIYMINNEKLIYSLRMRSSPSKVRVCVNDEAQPVKLKQAPRTAEGIWYGFDLFL